MLGIAEMLDLVVNDGEVIHMTYTVAATTITVKNASNATVGTITKDAVGVTFVQKIGVTLTGSEMIDIGTYMGTV